MDTSEAANQDVIDNVAQVLRSLGDHSVIRSAAPATSRDIAILLFSKHWPRIAAVVKGLPPYEVATRIVTEERITTIIISHVGVDLSEAKPHSFLFEDLGIDSIDMVEITLDLEREFGVEISDDDFRTIRRVRDLVDVFSMRSRGTDAQK